MVIAILNLMILISVGFIALAILISVCNVKSRVADYLLMGGLGSVILLSIIVGALAFMAAGGY